MARRSIIDSAMRLAGMRACRPLLLTLAPIVFFILVLIIRIPFPLRAVSQATRYGLTIVFPALLVLFFLCFRVHGMWGRVLSLTLTMTVFGLSLAGLWSKGESEYFILSGLIPVDDAGVYLADAKRLLAGYPMSDFSSWRPLFPAMLSGIYAISGMNLQVTQAILVALTGISCYLLAAEIQRTHGAAAAALTLTILFLYYRIVSGALTAESMGISLGALGLAALWSGASNKKKTPIFLGILLVTMALLSRHGTYFILPALVIWAGWLMRRQRRFSWGAFGWAAGAVACGIMIYLAATLVFTRQVKTPYSPYSTFFYDFSVGYPVKRGWVSQVYPQVFELPEPYRAHQIYQLGVEEIRNDPARTVNGALKQWLYFFGFGWYAVYGYLVSGTPIITRMLYAGMYILCLMTIVNWIQERSDAHLTLVVFGFLAIVLSVPFVSPFLHNRVRMYAATYPFLAVLPALGAAWFFKAAKWRCVNQSPGNQSPTSLAGWTGVGMVVFTICSPVVARTLMQPASFMEIECPGDQVAIYFHYPPGSQVNILSEHVMQMDWVPDIHNGRFTAYLHSMPHYDLIDELEANVHPPATILNVLDLRSGSQYLAIGDSMSFPPETGGILGACGMRSQNPEVEDDHIFYISSTTRISW